MGGILAVLTVRHVYLPAGTPTSSWHVHGQKKCCTAFQRRPADAATAERCVTAVVWPPYLIIVIHPIYYYIIFYLCYGDFELDISYERCVGVSTEKRSGGLVPYENEMIFICPPLCPCPPLLRARFLGFVRWRPFSPCPRRRPVCAGLPLLRAVGSVLVQDSVSHRIHTRLPYTCPYKNHTHKQTMSVPLSPR